MHLEIREVKAREWSTQRYLGFKNHRLGEIVRLNYAWEQKTENKNPETELSPAEGYVWEQKRVKYFKKKEITLYQMLVHSWNQRKEVTIGLGNMKIIGDPNMGHFHGLERTDPTRWRLRGETQTAGTGKNFDKFCPERKQRSEAVLEQDPEQGPQVFKVGDR